MLEKIRDLSLKRVELHPFIPVSHDDMMLDKIIRGNVDYQVKDEILEVRFKTFHRAGQLSKAIKEKIEYDNL